VVEEESPSLPPLHAATKNRELARKVEAIRELTSTVSQILEGASYTQHHATDAAFSIQVFSERLEQGLAANFLLELIQRVGLRAVVRRLACVLQIRSGSVTVSDPELGRCFA
jgi:hypothetical protein